MDEVFSNNKEPKCICAHCINNDALSHYIRNNAQMHCSYCDRYLEEGDCRAISVKKFVQHLLQYINNSYEQDLFTFKDSYFMNEYNAVDTHDLLWDLGISENETLLKDLESMLPESNWTKKKNGMERKLCLNQKIL